jgi:hypothetical protein
MKTNPALSALRHHVSGAIARGEAQAITEIPATTRPAHTPGPWYLNSRGWVVQSTGDIVTRLECSNNKEADARLIAAAPELLDALERISTAYDETLRHPIAAPLLQAIYGARAAIAKAKGGEK